MYCYLCLVDGLVVRTVCLREVLIAWECCLICYYLNVCVL